MRRLTHLIVLVAFMFSCGGHWVVFQAIAWANMVREYSEMVPLTQAVQMTFSGKYPCAICKAIAEKKASEQQQQALSLDKHENKFPLPAMIALAGPGSTSVEYRAYASRFSSRSETPLTPPPRAA